ncbi:MAG TPA: hypothetical protein VKZ49_10700 [Polyangiaceae bacterium]|nr:hypothetical protein [Polyangiaceae bacterium]
MQRSSVFASGTIALLLLAVGVQGCSDDSDDGGAGAGGSGGTGGPGSGGATTGGTGASTGGGDTGGGGTGGSTGGSGGATGGTGGATGGTSGAATGGSAGTGDGATGGSAGTGDGGMGGMAMGGAAGSSGGTTFCTGSPSDGVACTVTCEDLCGIHNLGQRTCTCTAEVFDCASCAYADPDQPLIQPPSEALPDCELPDGDQEDDASGCTDGDRCQSIGRTMAGGGDGENRFCACLGGEWDCDSKPSSWSE